MRNEIQDRYQRNLARVRQLVSVYQQLAGGGSGRRPVEQADLLRAAVVFLHATLEDVLRTLLQTRWATASDPEKFAGVPVALAHREASEKITLKDLVRLRGKSVDALIEESVEAYLERSNFNNVGDVKRALDRIGLQGALVDPHATSIAAMMSRRHQIVHRADRNDLDGSGNHAAASLGTTTVDAWLAAVEGLCRDIVAKL